MENEDRTPDRTGVQLGPVGESARRNVTRLRKAAGLSLADVSDRMTGDRRLSVSGLSKVETGGRKIDVDDLVAIAAAIDVSPLAILFGQAPEHDALVEAGGTGTQASALWAWAVGSQPMRDNDTRGFQARSLPWWLHVQTTYED
jgi:transcriptional regulator with XRE-family HTH domain